jgi:acyl-CoA dehydrogenase
MPDNHDSSLSPIHRAVWECAIPTPLFQAQPLSSNTAPSQAMQQAIALVRQAKESGQLFNADRKLSHEVEQELGSLGYWGLWIEREYGGHALPFRDFTNYLTRMASLEPTVAGHLAVHSCIGASNHIQHVGSPLQKQTWLPKLARGEHLSIFALTERNAGTDLTNIRTRAVREGDEWVISGEKFLITNAAPNRCVALVCRMEERLGMVVFALPEQESEQFQWINYDLHALNHTWNRGFRLTNFRVPLSALLEPKTGDGMSLAYHGLNRGRVSVCANAAGTMRIMMAGLLPWVRFRHTYGEPLGHRELITNRLARLAALIVGADALTAWCSSLIDQGYRGELEGIVAKVFAGNSLREAAIDISLKTHGGRAFLHGHRIGDYLHDYLAPGIYEGEAEIISLAFFRTLTKQHAVDLYIPLQKAAERLAEKRLQLWNPRHIWLARDPLKKYAKWRFKHAWNNHVALPANMPSTLREQAVFAARGLQNMAVEISRAMMQHGRRISNMQSRMLELSQRVQKFITILVVSFYGAQREHECERMAAELLCVALRSELSGHRPTDAYFRQAHALGRRIVAGEFSLLEAREPVEIMYDYENGK